MNSSMARMTKNSKVFYFIILMTFVYMMNMQSFKRLANKTFVRKISKSSFPIIATPFSVVFIFFTRSFKRMKDFLLAIIRTKFRIVFSTQFCSIFSTTKFTYFKNFSRKLLCLIEITFSRTITNFTIFALRHITRSLKEVISAIFTCNFNFIFPRTFVTSSRTINGTIFFKCVSTGWAYLSHIPSLALATVKVNKEVSNGNEI